MLQHVRSFIASLSSRPASRARNTIVLRGTGFQLLPCGQESGTGNCFHWHKITEVLAYKRDCITVDLICMAITDDVTAVEVNEEDAGWDEFIHAVEKNLPGSAPVDKWWHAVAQPPFATNQITVYRKEQPSS